MKEAVAGELATAYHSAIVERVRASDFSTTAGRLDDPPRARIRVLLRRRSRGRLRLPGAAPLPRPQRLPHRRDHPQPARERAAACAGIRFLTDPGESCDALGPDDVVILPGLRRDRHRHRAALERSGCTLVDTTCGSVLNVWKNVGAMRRTGSPRSSTARSSTKRRSATASQALEVSGGALPRRARSSARRRSSATTSAAAAIATAFLDRFGDAVSPGFDPDRDLAAHRLRESDDDADDRVAGDRRDVPGGDARRYGEAALAGAVPRVRHDLQRDAGAAGCGGGAARRAAARPDAGDRRLQQQQHLQPRAHLRRPKCPTFHIADPGCMVSATELQHRPVGAPSTTVGLEVTTRDWLPASGPVIVGLTAGASTPNNIVGEVIQRLERFVETG